MDVEISISQTVTLGYINHCMVDLFIAVASDACPA